MAYDSDAGFDAIDFSPPTPDAATPPDNAASGVMAAAGVAAMAATVADDQYRSGNGWDAPPPSMMLSRAVAPGTGWSLGDDDDSDDSWRSGRSARPVPAGDAGVTAQGRVLREVALRAYTLHPDYAHQSTAEVAHYFNRSELEGKSTSEQLATLQSTWREVDGARATALANKGVFVVAGLAGGANTSHTAVVVPGRGAMADRRAYPRVCGGGLPMRRSDGSKTAADTWTPAERAKVRYFTPETRSWLRRALAFVFS